MFKTLLGSVALLLCAGSAQAQVMLSTYANKDGYVDVQKLTCGQLASTFQEDADYISLGIAGKKSSDGGRSREGVGAPGYCSL